MPSEINHYFEKVPTLTSQRLVLREIEPDDIAAIVEISVYNGVFAKGVVEAARILAKIKADEANGETIHWGICLRDRAEVVGTCGYHRGFVGNVGEIGYVLKAAFRGQGIMTEAVGLVVDFGLAELKLSQVMAYTSPANRASIAVLQQVSFRQVANENADLKFVRSTRA